MGLKTPDRVRSWLSFKFKPLHCIAPWKPASCSYLSKAKVGFQETEIQVFLENSSVSSLLAAPSSNVGILHAEP